MSVSCSRRDSSGDRRVNMKLVMFIKRSPCFIEPQFNSLLHELTPLRLSSHVLPKTCETALKALVPGVKPTVTAAEISDGCYFWEM